MKIVILDAGTLDFDETAWEAFQRFGEVVIYDKTGADPDEVLARIEGADAVFTNKVPLSEAVFEKAGALRFVGVLATGYNVIDLNSASNAGVTVCNVPAYSTATTSQHAVALILELCNQVGRHSQSVHEGDWVRSHHFTYWKQAPLELEAMTVGIVGFGTIGRRVASTLHAMGARIMASARRQRNTPDYPGFEWADNESIFESADLVSLHCPQTPENTGFVNADLLSRMKPGALLVNTARGGLIEEAHLAAALHSGRLRGAALDVLTKEPMTPDCPLLGAPNCYITPHIAWASEPARRRLIDISVQNLEQFLQGLSTNVVNG
ncbi:D-2-hydroxyacid dehydrogenase [Coraliomargarita parva]|uniref:D-2-hydroxyacid dehydrogenase n=1 Tax=Coraliomargarita parva TaxID=3014050 RepID=UPI0022B5AAFC|nr:D-2-hydroxyacid dehydrogenase [Coraliomargarita parva]